MASAAAIDLSIISRAFWKESVVIAESDLRGHHRRPWSAVVYDAG
jgi:hypothetical protein